MKRAIFILRALESRLAWLRKRSLVTLMPLVFAGCLSDEGSRYRPDPLTGLPRNAPTTVSSTFGSTNPPASASLAVPGPNPPNNAPAANSQSSNGAWSQTPGAWSGTESRSTPTTAVPAKLGSPMPPSNSTASSSPVPNAGPAPSLRPKNFEDSEKILIAHGVNWQKLQMIDANSWEFSCTVPNKSKPNVMRTYEATDRYGLLAVQKVIDQIVRDQGQ